MLHTPCWFNNNVHFSLFIVRNNHTVYVISKCIQTCGKMHPDFTFFSVFGWRYASNWNGSFSIVWNSANLIKILIHTTKYLSSIYVKIILTFPIAIKDFIWNIYAVFTMCFCLIWIWFRKFIPLVEVKPNGISAGVLSISILAYCCQIYSLLIYRELCRYNEN